MELRPESEFRDAVVRAAERHGCRIRTQVPGAVIEHIGATSVPGALTKGDLDLLVRVTAKEFIPAREALASLYSVNQPENWNVVGAAGNDELDPGASSHDPVDPGATG